MGTVTKIEQTPTPITGREFATTGDTMNLVVGPNGVISPMNFGILRSLASNLEIFECVLQDFQVQSVLSQRRLALISKEWDVLPASESAQDKAAADFMRELLQALQWDDITDKMHYGVFYGFSVAEMMYRRDGRFITVDRVIARKRDRFRFDLSGNLRLLTRPNVVDGEIMPAGKFWCFATGGDNHENPYGIGLAHWLYWPVWFKNNGLKFWSIYLDKFGMPTALGQHDFGADDERLKKLLEALQAIHTDSGVAVPKGVEISLLEATRNGTSDYETFLKYLDNAIAKVTVGQVASTEGTPGRLGNEDLQSDVREDLVKADADLICESWNRGPARWLTEWNFPGAKPPRVWREVEPDEDLNERVQRDKTLFDIGFKPTPDYITQTYGDGYEEKPAPVMPLLRNPLAPGEDDDDAGRFAAAIGAPTDDALKLAIDTLLQDDESLNRQSGQVIEPVFALVRRFGPERALQKLVERLPTISHDLLTEALARVLFLAETVGRISAERNPA